LPELEIRAYRSEDSEGASALMNDSFPQPSAITPAAIEHWIASAPERSHARAWVGYEGDGLVAWGDAHIRWSVVEQGIAEVWAAVRRDRRGAGIGRQVYALAESHVLGVGARRIETFAREDEPESIAFAERRGFSETRRERTWALDLGSVEAPAPRAPDGFRVVRLADQRERESDLFELFNSAHADMPSDHTHELVFEEWRRETLENPELDLEMSAVVLAGDRPVAFAWLASDRDTGIASHEMTGTHADFRGRGFARLAKEAAIHWAREAGLKYLTTSNDGTNDAMLGLNDRLGYEPRATLVEFAKTV
jgi:GNAT superfamily N-acetyltransferase